MHAAVLTFPGHFFQTLLSIKSLIEHYRDTSHVTVVLDDIDQGPWLTYASDCFDQISELTTLPVDIKRTSQLGLINQCVAGWWRQQLVKCCLDQIVSGQHWFVVDGDTIFETHCDVQDRVPITRRHDRNSRFSLMSQNYVRGLLGIEQGYLTDRNEWVCTNAVPFRWLDRSFLESLRSRIEQTFNKEFVRLHLDWFQDQTIVADHDPPDRMVMSEWELMECYRRYVLRDVRPFHDVGSGYPHDIDRSRIAQTHDVFRHAYRWDSEIGSAWFESRGLAVDPDTWQRSQQWYQSQRDRGYRG